MNKNGKHFTSPIEAARWRPSDSAHYCKGVETRWSPELCQVSRVDPCDSTIAEQLDRKLAACKPETAVEVERLVGDIIDWADADALDLMRSRDLEQEVLDVLEECFVMKI